MSDWMPNPNAFREHEAKRIGEALAIGLTNYEDGCHPAVLDVWPAKEFKALLPKDCRAARELWAKAEVAVAFEGVCPTHMMALKSSPIWFELSEYGLPFGPYDAETRFLDRDVEFAKAEAAGLVHEGDALVNAVDLWRERILQAVRNLPPDILEELLARRG